MSGGPGPRYFYNNSKRAVNEKGAARAPFIYRATSLSPVPEQRLHAGDAGATA